MTAATSSKKSFFWTRFFKDISTNKQLFIINCVFQLLGLPVICTCVDILMYLENLDNYDGYMDAALVGCVPFIMLGCGTICLSILMGIVIALIHFSSLYRKSIVDMHYSLPLSTTQRFFADFFSGLGVYLVPPIAAIFVGIFILTCGWIFTDKSDVWEYMPEMLQLASIVIVGMALIYTMSVFAVSFVGSTFEAILGVCSFMVLIPSTVACMWLALVTSAPYGITGEAILYNHLLISTSPIGALIYFFEFISEIDSETPGMLLNYIKWVGISLLFCVLYTAASYFLVKFRKAEDVSKPYVYKAFFYAIMTMGVFSVISLFISLRTAIIASVIMCAVPWFIMEIITRRGFKKFWTAPIGFVSAVLSVFLICGLCAVTNGFGMAKHVPSAASVGSVEINFDDYTDHNSVKITDRKVIKEVIKLNKLAVDNYFHYNEDDYNITNDLPGSFANANHDNHITIKYHMLTGSVVTREYTINSEIAGDLVKTLYLTDEYADTISSRLGYVYHSGTFSVRVSNKFYQSVNSAEISTAEGEELRQAYCTDLKNMTEADLEEGNIYCYLDNSFVLDSFDNTKALLKSFGYSKSNLGVEYNDSAAYIDMSPVFLTNANYFYDKKNKSHRSSYDYSWYYQGRPAAIEDKITVTGPETSYSYDVSTNARYIIANNEDTRELFNRCTTLVFSEKVLAKIYIDNGCILYLTDEGDNRELLKKAEDHIHKNYNYKRQSDYWYD